MSDIDRTKKDLVSEIQRLRRRVVLLEASMHKDSGGTTADDAFERQTTDNDDLLMQSERRLRESQRIAQMGSYTYDFATDRWSSTQVLDEIVGIDVKYEKNAAGWIAIVHPKDRRDISAYLRRVLDERIPLDREVRIVRITDGAIRWLHGRGELIRNAQGQPTTLLGTLQDITDRKQAEQELRESQEQFSQFMDRLPHGVFIKDESSKVIFVNQYVKDLFGGEQWIGKDAHGAFPNLPEVAEAMHADDRKALNDGNTTIEEAMPDNKGVEHVFRTTKFRISRTNKPPLIGGIGLDITDRVRAEEALRHSEERYKTLYKEAKETEERYHSLMNSTLDAIVIYDVEGRVTYINNAFTAMFGYGLEEIEKGVPYVPEPEKEVAAQNVKKVIQDGLPLKDFETKRLTKNGRLVDVSISASRFNDHLGDPAGMLVILRDITQHKNSEKLLRQAKEAAEAASRAKSTFLANMSHELRTPLNAILGFSELMQRDPGISMEQSQYLETIGRSGEHLLSLINDVLEFSKIEAGRTVLNLNDFDLHLLLFGLEEMLMLRAQQKGITLDFACDPDVPQYVHADQNKLRQILINLLGNALKFTDTGGVRLSVIHKPIKEEKIDGASLHFEVADTGCGISKQDEHNIFDAFYQSDFYPSSLQGTGLGLPISRKFVELMGGTLKVSSQVGKGTTFAFDIQVALAKCSDMALNRLHRRVIGLTVGQPTIRLLVVEDNDNNRNLLVALLQSVGFEVQEAVNGREAIEIWRQWRPHLIWMDIRMPVMDGYEATAIIRSEAQETDYEMNPKIIALTASAFEEDRLKAIEHGGNDFVRKPFKDTEIFEMIHKHLGISYIFEQEENLKSASLPGSLTNNKLVSSLMKLPVDLLDRLKEATELSEAALIDQVIKEISTKDKRFAMVLFQLAENFAYDRILDLMGTHWKRGMSRDKNDEI